MTDFANSPLPWTYRDTRDSEYAIFTVGKLTCTVQDMDGDASTWTITEEGPNRPQVIAESLSSIYNGPQGQPYHFEIAKAQAYDVLVVEAKKRGLYCE